MGVRILYDRESEYAALYCSTRMVAFGPVFSDGDERDAEERAELFVKWLPQDARRLSDAELLERYGDWLSQEAEQVAALAAAEED